VTSNRRRVGLLSAAASLALTLAACSSDDSPEASASRTSSSSAAPESSAAPVAEGPFGPACRAFPATGAGSFAAMATAPVVTAAAANPVLTTLAKAVAAVHLGESLDSQQDVTVLAPANPAFEAMPADQLAALVADSARLTSVLTHHVIQGRLTPDQLAGTHTTLNNDEVTIEGSGQSFTIAGAGTLTEKDASVICGNVQTANATVYLIDQVLAPTPT
jgi:uncharacterized surface protein with fasciclin (FAS1) repeats